MELLTIAQVAKLLNVHQRTVRRYIEKGQLRGERVGGSWRVSEDALRTMFDQSPLKETMMENIQKRSEDMLDVYLQGKHRLQQTGDTVLTVFTFDPQREAWMTLKSAEWMTELNRLGQSAPFDFTMTGNETGLRRWTLIAPFALTQAMLAELERLRETA